MSFERLAELGYGPFLLPILPWDAPVSAYSKDPDLAANRGKVPGRRVSDGWVGFAHWQHFRASPVDWELWATWPGVGVGLSAERFPAFDIDVTDPVAAQAIQDMIEHVVGKALPTRVGRAPKRLLVVAGVQGLRKRTFKFEIDGEKHLVEFLATGQQFVVDGIHPKTQRPYTWTSPLVAPDDLALVTQAVLDEVFEALGMMYAGKDSGSHSVTDIKNSDELLAPSIDAVRAALDAVPNDFDYDTWVRVGAAIKAATGGSEDGCELWLEWSAQYDASNTAVAEQKWNSFRAPYRLGWDFLSRFASTHAPKGTFSSASFDFDVVEVETPPPPTALPVSVDLELSENIDDVLERFVWVSHFGQGFDLKTRKMMSPLQFSVLNNHVGAPTSSTKSAWSKWLAKNNLKRVDSITYRPGGELYVQEGRELCLNTWMPSDMMTVEGDVTPWLDHMAYMYPDHREREILFDWLAFLLQYPGEKPPFQVVMGSTAEGIGKDLAMLPVIAAIGQENTRTVTANQVCSQYTDWYEGRRLIVVEEMESFGRRETANSLKPYLTAPPLMVPIAKKYAPVYEVPNIAGVIFFTNNENAIPVPRGDRRVFVIWSDVAPRSEAYYETFATWQEEEGGANMVAHWLLQRDLKEHLKRRVAPMTEAKRTMQRAALTPLEDWVQSGIEDETGPFRNDLVEVSHVLAAARSHLRWDQGTPERMASHLKRAGALSLGRVRFETADALGILRGRLYAIRRQQMYEGLAPAKLRELYERAQDVDNVPEFSKVLDSDEA